LETAKTRPTPLWVINILLQYGSIGSEPKYRIIWSEDRMEMRWGVQYKRYGDGLDRWILEKMVEWADYGEWNLEAFGPKPHINGEYEHSQTVEVLGQYISLEDYGAKTIILMLECIEKGKLIPRSEKLRFKRDQLAERDRQFSQNFSDIYEEAQNPFGANAVAGIPGKKKPEDMRIITLDQLPENFRKQLAKPGKIRQVS